MFLVNAPLKIIVVSWGEKRGWLTWLKDDIIINGSELYAHNVAYMWDYCVSENVTS